MWVEGQADWARPLLAWFTGEDRQSSVLLPGGKQVSFGFPQPQATTNVALTVKPTVGTMLLDLVIAAFGVGSDELLGVGLSVLVCVAEPSGSTSRRWTFSRTRRSTTSAD